jgi:hypothetical protein
MRDHPENKISGWWKKKKKTVHLAHPTSPLVSVSTAPGICNRICILFFLSFLQLNAPTATPNRNAGTKKVPSPKKKKKKKKKKKVRFASSPSVFSMGDKADEEEKLDVYTRALLQLLPRVTAGGRFRRALAVRAMGYARASAECAPQGTADRVSRCVTSDSELGWALHTHRVAIDVIAFLILFLLFLGLRLYWLNWCGCRALLEG